MLPSFSYICTFLGPLLIHCKQFLFNFTLKKYWKCNPIRIKISFNFQTFAFQTYLWQRHSEGDRYNSRLCRWQPPCQIPRTCAGRHHAELFSPRWPQHQTNIPSWHGSNFTGSTETRLLKQWFYWLGVHVNSHLGWRSEGNMDLGNREPR